MSQESVVVTDLRLSPVKGMRLEPRAHLTLGRSGVLEDRRFFIIDARGRMVNGKQIGELMAISADYSDADRALTLGFPGGEAVSGRIELGEPLEVGFYSLRVRAAPVLGAFSDALSAHLGQRLTLLEAAPEAGALDRGGAGAVSLIARASLTALARVAGRQAIDARRFRMHVEVDGVEANAEDGWVGESLRIGSALVAVGGHVGRCLVTSRDPESGTVDLPTLDLLRSYRQSAETTEPLALGIYGRVLEPGEVRVGDRVLREPSPPPAHR